MSYDLTFELKPPIPERELLLHFECRNHYSRPERRWLEYDNPETDVHFRFRYDQGGLPLVGRSVRWVYFELNYLRPTYFVHEADLELQAFITAFPSAIQDGQIDGMGSGPYSKDGLLKGWSFGNAFTISSTLRGHPDIHFQSLPRDALMRTWRWNHQRQALLLRLDDRQYLPRVMLLEAQGRASRTALWPSGRPVLLPQIDHVLVGREVGGDKEVGLADWSEVADLVRRAGFDADADPVDLGYAETPPAIADWVASIQAVDFGSLSALEPGKLVDREALEAADRISGSD